VGASEKVEKWPVHFAPPPAFGIGLQLTIAVTQVVG
jgi:hypothetical protein